jgi:Cu-Zn family superoxide dismutase
MPKLRHCAALAAAIAVAAGPAGPAVAEVSATARAAFIGTDGQQLGTATLSQTPSGVLISTDVRGLPEGVHAFHIHETGVCDPATDFTSAGGHYAPRGNAHGFIAEGGPHAGDMPNQTVHANGIMQADVFNPRISLDPEAADTLFDEDGSAFVIHANADDYVSQPAGAAGPRIACGVIER